MIFVKFSPKKPINDFIFKSWSYSYSAGLELSMKIREKILICTPLTIKSFIRYVNDKYIISTWL